MKLLKNWNGNYCIESFHPAVLLHLKKHYPQVILTFLLTTFLTRPDFIAYNYLDRSCPSLHLMKRLYHVQEAGWTIRDCGNMEALEKEGVIPIFEGFIPD